MLKVDAASDRQVQATVALLKLAPSRVRTVMRQAARKALNRLWRPALQARATSTLQRRALVAGARANVGSDDFTLLAATRSRPLSGGLVPTTQWHGPELGMAPRTAEVKIQGRARRQIIGRNLGYRTKKGKVVYPAAREVAPQVVATWTEAVVAGAFKGTEAETVKGA